MNMNKIFLLIFMLFLLLTPSYVASAATKKITVYCYCTYEDGSVNCPDDCTPAGIEEKVIKDCGGRESTVDSVEYSCATGIGLINIGGLGKGASPIDACQNYVNSHNVNRSDLKVRAKATCTPKMEGVGEYICEEEDVLKVLTFAGYLLYFAKILVPFIIILMGTFDYYKAVTADKDDELSKQTKIFIRRIILGIIVFFIPTILNTFMSLLSDRSAEIALYEECVTCILEPLSCNK